VEEGAEFNSALFFSLLSLPFLDSFSYLHASPSSRFSTNSQTFMSGSFNFFFHIVAVGLLFVVVVGGWLLHRKIVHEKDMHLKLYVSTSGRVIGLLSPFVTLLLLVTGIGNIYNRYLGSDLHWYSEGWLVAKIIFFAIAVVNGAVFGAMLARKRTALLQSIDQQVAPANADTLLKDFNRQFSWHYVVQFLLLALIILLSTFGSGKHPGAF